jgi:hypothetical protein
MERLGSFLESLKTDTSEPTPSLILSDPAFSEALPVEIHVDRVALARRFEAGRFLYDLLAPLRITEHMSLERDAGLWSWLSLFFFDELCPAAPDGTRKPGERARWIPRFDAARRYYRHLLVGPYLIFKLYANDPDVAMVLLCTKPHAPGDIVEQFVSRPQLVTSSAAVGAATKLYHVPDGTFRRGAAGKEGGSVRRLADVLMQLDRTYDLYALSPGELLDLLPREFDRFRLPAGRRPTAVPDPVA